MKEFSFRLLRYQIGVVIKVLVKWTCTWVQVEMCRDFHWVAKQTRQFPCKYNVHMPVTKENPFQGCRLSPAIG